MEKVKELWVRLGLKDRDFPAEDMVCQGCFPENECAYAELRACVNEKGHENCGLCDEYPCELANSMFRKSEKLKNFSGKLCTQKEMDVFDKAFFSKKEYFDYIHQEQRKEESKG